MEIHLDATTGRQNETLQEQKAVNGTVERFDDEQIVVIVEKKDLAKHRVLPGKLFNIQNGCATSICAR